MQSVGDNCLGWVYVRDAATTSALWEVCWRSEKVLHLNMHSRTWEGPLGEA